MSRLIRPITLALALLVLCSSVTYAFPSAGQLTRQSLLAALWDQVVAWVMPGGVSQVEKAGSQMDPNGAPLDPTDPHDLEFEAGGFVDQNGNR